MLVAAALRWSDTRATVDPLSGQVHTDPYAAGPGPADRCALEYALRIAEELGGRCLALCVGPPAAEEMLREALAAGAHDVLRIDTTEQHPYGGGAVTAAALHAGLAARGAAPDLVVCGDRSAEHGTGTTPGFLAALLGASQALGLLELTAGTGELRALRPLDGGRREVLGLPLPAVCSVQPGTVAARRAPLPAVLAARTAPVPHVTLGPGPDCGVRAGRPRPYRPRPRVLPPPGGQDPRERLLALTTARTPPRTPPRLITPATPAEAADLLLARLQDGPDPRPR